MEKVTMAELYSRETMNDPIAFFSQLLERQEPLFRLDDVYGLGGAWVALGYDDVAAILKDQRFIKDIKKVMPQPGEDAVQKLDQSDEFINWLIQMPNMLSVDPPDHTRLRRLAAYAFTPQSVETLRPRIERIAGELLDAVRERGRMELMTEFAYPLSITVISEMLGVPEKDRGKFRQWTQTLMGAVDPGKRAEGAAALHAFTDYVKELLAEKRRKPEDDLISKLIAARDQGDALSENELLSTIWLFITAGHETTVNLIGNGVLELLRHPGQLSLLRENPALLPSAVEELLRFAGPIIMGSRFAGEDIEMHGQTIRKGEMVIVSLTAANIDPRRFASPETMDITREENRHLAFGHGIHHCMGAPLARLEGQIALGALLSRMPHLRLDAEPDQVVWSQSKFRSLAELPIAF